jgi:hypothetical protein
MGFGGSSMKVGDLVMCTGGHPLMKRMGVIRKVFNTGMFGIYIFDPPNKHWNRTAWSSPNIEVIYEGR